MPDVVRHAVRLLIADEQDRLLLLHYLTPDTGDEFWCTPGGARDVNETDLGVARREAREELGMEVDGLGPLCGQCGCTCFVSAMGGSSSSTLIRRNAFRPTFTKLGDFEREAVVGCHWWALDELREPGSAPLTPPRLDALVDGCYATARRRSLLTSAPEP